MKEKKTVYVAGWQPGNPDYDKLIFDFNKEKLNISPKDYDLFLPFSNEFSKKFATSPTKSLAKVIFENNIEAMVNASDFLLSNDALSMSDIGTGFDYGFLQNCKKEKKNVDLSDIIIDTNKNESNFDIGAKIGKVYAQSMNKKDYGKNSNITIRNLEEEHFNIMILFSFNCYDKQDKLIDIENVISRVK